jgi:aerobic carbon-monoxide dehydrogenase medium subunit
MTTKQAYFAPTALAEALTILAEYPEAKAIAGGATLVAMMNARVMEPSILVSLAGIAELQGIHKQADGSIRIGAFTRHRESAAHDALSGDAFVVRSAASQIANATVRNMGTIGGSIAFADPSLDYPPALVALGASIEMCSTQGKRVVSAREFFVDWYTTALAPSELVSAVILPKPDSSGRGLYVKHARVAGDYAIASVAACRSGAGQWRVAVGACGPTPLFDEQANGLLSADTSDAAIAKASEGLVAAADPVDDVRGSAEYRRLLIPRMLRKAIRAVESASS